MGCVYNDFHGRCELWDEGVTGDVFTEDGICVIDDEQEPEDWCPSFVRED